VTQQCIRVRFGSALPEGAPGSDGDGKLNLKVIFTDLPQTAAALRIARDMARGLGARITLIATQVVPYPLPLTAPDVPVAFTERQLKSIVPENIAIQVFLCRDRCEALRRALPHDAVVIVGAPNRRWWPSWETQLTRLLRREGRNVLMVNA